MLIRVAEAARAVLVEMTGLQPAPLPSSAFSVAWDDENKPAALVALSQMSQELRQRSLTTRTGDAKGGLSPAQHVGGARDGTYPTTIGGSPARGAFA